jgi:hypothetical protein
MAVIFSLFLWILWDVAFAVYTEIAVHKLTSPEWILAGTGILIAVAALIFEFREREATTRREHCDHISRLKAESEFKQRLAASDGKIETRLDVVTQLGIESVRKLQVVTHTADQSIGSSILAATSQIAVLTEQVTELTEATRHITPDQRRRFGQALPQVLPELFARSPQFEYHGVRVTYGSTIEAQNYAEEISRLFGEHGLTTSTLGEFTRESLNISGLRILIVDPSNPTANDRKTLALLDAAGIEYKIEQRATEFPNITVLRVGKTFSR